MVSKKTPQHSKCSRFIWVFSCIFEDVSFEFMFHDFPCVFHHFPGCFHHVPAFFPSFSRVFSHHCPAFSRVVSIIFYGFSVISQVIPSLHLDELSRGVNMETARFFRNDFEEQRGTKKTWPSKRNPSPLVEIGQKYRGW